MHWRICLITCLLLQPTIGWADEPPATSTLKEVEIGLGCGGYAATFFGGWQDAQLRNHPSELLYTWELTAASHEPVTGRMRPYSESARMLYRDPITERVAPGVWQVLVTVRTRDGNDPRWIALVGRTSVEVRDDRDTTRTHVSLDRPGELKLEVSKPLGAYRLSLYEYGNELGTATLDPAAQRVKLSFPLVPRGPIRVYCTNTAGLYWSYTVELSNRSATLKADLNQPPPP